MIKFDFQDDAEFIETVNSMISCLLPHENYNGKYFSDILEKLLGFVRIEEMPCHYGVLTTVLESMKKIVVLDEDFTPSLDRASFDRFLGAGIQDYIDVNSREVTTWLTGIGEVLNLDIPKDNERAKEVLYSMSMELYETCLNLSIDTSSYPTLILTMREAFKANAIMEGQIVLRNILGKGLWVGKKKYKGLDDFLSYSLEYINEIRYRLDEEGDDNTIVLDDLSKAKKIMDMNKQQSQALGKYGIPEMDDFTPMLRHRLVVIAATENTGKTLFSTHLTATLLLEGKTVVYMCGEAPENQILNKILPSYIFRKYGKFISETQCMGSEEIDPEHDRLIKIAMKEIVESGNFIFRGSFTYDDCGQELIDLYQKKKFDAVFIDHSASMVRAPGSKLFSEKDCIDCAAVQLRNFKKKFPVFVCVTSHPSFEAAKEIEKFKCIKTASPTRSSGVLSKEADEVFFMYRTEELNKQNKIAFQITKRRLARVPINHIYLKVNYVSYMFNYNDEDQSNDESLVKKERLIEEINNFNQATDSDFDFDILEGDD